MAVDSGPFPQAALDANKDGRLTDMQRKLITVSLGGSAVTLKRASN